MRSGAIVVGTVVLAVLLVILYSYLKATIHRELNNLIGSNSPTDGSALATGATGSHIMDNLQLPPGMTSTVSAWLKSWQPDSRQEIERLVAKKVDWKNPQLIEHLKKVVVPPTKHKPVKVSRRIEKTPQLQEALKVLKNKKKGFFIECGAFDGERSSNTFYLEQELGWTGLLVEMDPFFFLQVLGRSRNAWSLNACLSPTQNPQIIPFKEHYHGQGKLGKEGSLGVDMPCYPLASVLRALNVSHVDYFSLDVEGLELPILKSIPWKEIDISVISAEYNHGEPKSDYKKYMSSQGYRVHKDIVFHDTQKVLYVNDFMFVKEPL